MDPGAVINLLNQGLMNSGPPQTSIKSSGHDYSVRINETNISLTWK